MEHNYFMFNQFTYNNEKMKDNLMKASMLSNGGAFLRLNFERPKYAVA
jgi:hypothetical protein